MKSIFITHILSKYKIVKFKPYDADITYISN